MGILDNPTQIAGIKTQRRATGKGIVFDKDKPLTKYNFPLSNYTLWKIYGWRWDSNKIFKKPFWIEKRLPTGEPLICPELDGIYSATPHPVGIIPPQQEKRKEYHDIPYLENQKVKWRSQSI